MRKYLIEQSNYCCSKCGWGETNPITQVSPLVLNHIDGDSTNNKIENLEILCPNCDSLTTTYKSLNKGRGRYSRMERYRKGQSF